MLKLLGGHPDTVGCAGYVCSQQQPCLCSGGTGFEMAEYTRGRRFRSREGSYELLRTSKLAPSLSKCTSFQLHSFSAESGSCSDFGHKIDQTQGKKGTTTKSCLHLPHVDDVHLYAAAGAACLLSRVDQQDGVAALLPAAGEASDLKSVDFAVSFCWGQPWFSWTSTVAPLFLYTQMSSQYHDLGWFQVWTYPHYPLGWIRFFQYIAQFIFIFLGHHWLARHCRGVPFAPSWCFAVVCHGGASQTAWHWWELHRPWRRWRNSWQMSRTHLFFQVFFQRFFFWSFLYI